MEVFKKRSALARKKKILDKQLRKRNALLAAALAIARKEARVKQSDAAYRFGRDQTFIAKLERGVRRIAFVEVEFLAELYGKQLADFWDDIPPVHRLAVNASYLGSSMSK